jgi:uncharacterized damage-inducible protein DinB
MLKEALLEIFERDLLKLKEEIGLYPDENLLWEVRGNIANSPGNLCLHLVGNLNHFIGAILGNTGYVRERDLEFALKNIPRSELLSAVEHAVGMVKNTLENLTEEDLQSHYPVEKHGQTVTMAFMLLHLLTHFNYHLGQINYHRRLVNTPN